MPDNDEKLKLLEIAAVMLAQNDSLRRLEPLQEKSRAEACAKLVALAKTLEAQFDAWKKHS